MPLREKLPGTASMPEGATARKEYMSLVDNQILPLLRQTFGAQFTAKEGESLKATLGDPDATPEQKDAVIRSFIDQKKQTINSLEREAGEPLTDWGNINIGNVPAPTAPMSPAAKAAEVPANLQAESDALAKGDLYQAGETAFNTKKNKNKVVDYSEYFK